MLPYAVSFLVAAALLGLDQWSKFWVDSNMSLGETLPLFGPVLELHCVHNYGVAWSLFANMRWILVGVTGCVIIAVAAVIMLRLIRHPAGVFAAFLILGGGIGNLLDRIFLGYVVDMLRFPFWTSYPTFNVADICVVSGCVLWLVYALFLPESDMGRGSRGRDRNRKVQSRGAKSAGNAASGTDTGNQRGVRTENPVNPANNPINGANGGEDGKPARRNPDPAPRGANDDWQEKWRKRQLERQGRR